MATYVACDITGRLSGDLPTLAEVVAWMNEKNPDSGDCVIWEKPAYTITAIRTGGVWLVSKPEFCRITWEAKDKYGPSWSKYSEECKNRAEAEMKRALLVTLAWVRNVEVS